MSRFLFVVPPLVGHVAPAAGVAAQLRAAGHQVAWAGARDVVGPLAGAGALIYRCPVPPLADRPAQARGFAALKFLWEEVLLPLAVAMAPGVLAAVDHFRPDVLVVDQQALAGAVVATRTGIPWATSATTSSELVDPLAGLPRVEQWRQGLIRQLLRCLGDADPSPAAGNPPDLRFSPHLVLAFTTAALLGEYRPPPGCGPVRFVGLSRQRQDGTADFPWQRLDGRPLLYVTLGTVNSAVSGRFLSACVEAVVARPHLQAVLVDPAGTLPPAPGPVLVQREVPQLAVLERAAAVLCHAGHNTVCEALGQGLPLVVAPIRDDQPIVAEQVVRAGAGLRVRFGRAEASHLGQAIDAVLAVPGYRTAAERVRDSFRAAGGSAAAARHLETLAARPVTLKDQNLPLTAVAGGCPAADTLVSRS